jgi:hypothetical protein
MAPRLTATPRGHAPQAGSRPRRERHAAFEQLVQLSHHDNVNLRDVAERVVEQRSNAG